MQSHSRNLLPMVQALLAEAGMPLGRCDAVAFGAGPGSFTGVRTACGIAQGIGYGCDLPVLAIDTLKATAQACREASGASDILVALDARMEEVYWGQYRWQATTAPASGATHAGYWEEIVAARLGLPATVAPEGAVLSCGNGIAIYADTFAGKKFVAGARADLMPHASQVATLAQEQFALGAATSAREALPVYLRNEVALTSAERAIRRVGAA
ncbi:MAG: tRNA (adenosine(37)-N6)-threonylcarbamoyltransferase complex dimerization subunit type 1 TsaB [Burkholderiaceae bacterium]